jgi:hypothetical protein
MSAGVKKMCHVCTIAINRYGTLSLVTTWKGLERIVLSEISQAQKDKNTT